MATKDVVEPVVIVTLFVVACLVSRRRGSSQARDVEGGRRRTTVAVHDDSDYEYSSPPLEKHDANDAAADAFRTPRGESSSPSSSPSSSLFFRLLSRFWNKYPFLPEIWYWNLTYWIYQLMRALSARMIAGRTPVFDLARTHALQILWLERWLGINVELALQRFVLGEHPGLMAILARVYYSHICVGVAFLGYAFACTPRSAFRRVRCTLAADNAIAFVVVTLWRCSPPRLLPEEYGYVDVLHGGMPGGGSTGGASAWTNNRFQLTIAAMPSLHFGTSLLLGVYLWRFAPHGVVRAVAPLWPAAMLVTILATANHFVLDAAVGSVIPWFGWRYGGVMARLSVVQDWMFGPVRRRMDIIQGEGEGEYELGKMMVD